MNYIAIENASVTNGEGVRVVLWVSGCGHHCKNCQNEFSWNPNVGKPFTDETMKTLKELVQKEYIDGLTLSGGDPLYPQNRDTVLEICKEIKKLNKTIWLYTGYTYEEVKDLEILKYVDVLVDGRYVDELRDINLEFRGSSNQRLIKLGLDK